MRLPLLCLPKSPLPLPSLPRGSLSSPRRIVTLAIETSCDDTAVAILRRTPQSTALLFNDRISSDNRAFGGIHPLVAAKGHSAALAPLVKRALASLPDVSLDDHTSGDGDGGKKTLLVNGTRKQVPDFIAVTRGPGMRSNLGIGLDMAKGLAVAWDVPLVGVHHMQAHALTPRLARALGMDMGETSSSSSSSPETTSSTASSMASKTGPEFPFLSLLVSGGHTQLVHSSSLTAHALVAESADIAVGNLLDQVARAILPPDVLAGSDSVMYGRLLESFAFPELSSSATSSPSPSATDRSAAYSAIFTPPASRAAEMSPLPTPYPWSIPLPLRNTRRLAFTFTSIYTHVRNITTANPHMPVLERRTLAQHVMATAFTHIAGRLCLALQDHSADLAAARTLVVSGGVASNRFLRHVLRTTLDARGFGGLKVVAPPGELCTDNAAMVAWTGVEMFEAGWESELGITGIGRWPMDPGEGEGEGEGQGGILGVEGWVRREGWKVDEGSL